MSEAAVAAFPWSLVPEPDSGQKRSGYLTWRDTVLRELRWPYIAVRGIRPGPAVAVIAAIHGGEYPGILGALRLGRLLDPTRVHGALLIVPIANVASFWERSAFITPQDGRNLNRSFPGRATGTFSEVLALRLLEDVVGPAAAVLDLHSGDVFETLADHVAWFRSGDDDLDALVRRMAGSFGVASVVTYPLPAQARSLTSSVARLGKAGLCVEVGGNGRATDAQVLTVYQGLVNTLRVLGVLSGQPPVSSARWFGPGTQLSAPGDGLWQPAVTLAQQVRAGDLLGILSDPLGQELARLTADADGQVLYFMSALAVRSGEPLVYVVGDEE
jgi:predicted deacylase